MRRGGILKRIPLKRFGQRAKIWKVFRDAKADKDRDENGLLHCQDWKIGLPRCYVARHSLDLHHTEGREGKLLLQESKTVWLSRACHRKAHP